MTCDDVRAAYLAGEATSDQLRHLAACPYCREERAGLDVALTLLDDDGFWDTPPPELEDRIVDLVGGPAPEARATRRSWVSLAVGAAAVAAIAIALLGAWTVLQDPAPDWEVTLPGTDTAPLAVGVVRGWNEPGGTRLALEVEGLEPAPDGSFYEFWFSEGDRHISSGTFVVADGTEMWVGVSRRDFPRLWITLEPIDANESPSGVTVMDTG